MYLVHTRLVCKTFEVRYYRGEIHQVLMFLFGIFIMKTLLDETNVIVELGEFQFNFVLTHDVCLHFLILRLGFRFMISAILVALRVISMPLIDILVEIEDRSNGSTAIR